MKKAFKNIFVKMGVIFGLILILIIPSEMVQSLISERMYRHEEAVAEVSSKHAEQQSVIGPILHIPYKIAEPEPDKKGNPIYKQKGIFHVLPEHLTIEGEIMPEERRRGIFTVAVFGSEMKIDGTFENVDFAAAGLREEDLELDKATLSIGITDLKGLTKQVRVNVNGKEVVCNPGLTNRDVFSSGVHFAYPIDSINGKLNFNFDLNLNGSEYLGFAPIGKETTVRLKSKWENPSFDGAFLPISRDVSEDGFEAEWKVLNLNRNYPQSWRGNKYSINNSGFGVALMLGMDVYQKSTRVAKYSMLFVVLTFLVFFFVEVINKILIHPIQYILVGVALVLFYVLMLSFGEQIVFDWAYLLAAAMTVSLIMLYSKTILKSWGMAMMTGAILAIMYGFIFIIIQLQDYALLFGSLGVFAILAVTMYFSRKIDWFAIEEDKEE